MRRPRRLTIVFPAREIGGAERYVQWIARAAVQRGWQVTAAFPALPATAAFRRDLQSDGVRCIDLPIGHGHGEGWRRAVTHTMRELGQTLRVLLRTRATTTLVSLPYPEGSPGAVLAAAWLPGPSMVTVHLVPDGFQYTRLRRALYRLATATSQRWVTPSEDCRARLATALGCEVARIERIYHGVELGPDPARPARQADRDAARRALGLPCDAVILLSVARLTHQKGYDVLAAAIPAVALHDPRALWVWVGDGDRRSELTEQLGSLGVGDRVMLLGDRDDVRRLLAAADLFVLPTRYEAFGLAVLEAMAAGVPIIATDVGSLREIVTDDVHARLVPPEDPAALSAAMAWAIAHPVEMRALAVTAHARARTSFRPEGMIVETLAALEPGGAPQRALS